jgi:hypothetical protein
VNERHSFASHPFEAGCDIRAIRDLLGHCGEATTMVYTHVLNRGPLGVRSALPGRHYLLMRIWDNGRGRSGCRACNPRGGLTEIGWEAD